MFRRCMESGSRVKSSEQSYIFISTVDPAESCVIREDLVVDPRAD